MTNKNFWRDYEYGRLWRAEFFCWFLAVLLPGVTAYDWLTGKDIMPVKTMMGSTCLLAGALVFRRGRKKSSPRHFVRSFLLTTVLYGLFLISVAAWLDRY